MHADLRPRSLAPALAALALLVAPPVHAQIVRGQVVEDATATPVQGAMVILLELDGAVVRRVLTDAAGSFIIQAAHPGAYTLRVDRIGYESLSTPRFDVPPEGTFQRVTVPIRPVELEGLQVEGSRRCRLRAEQGPATAKAWEEARKALEAAAWTLASGAYRYTLLHVERSLARDGRTVERESRRFARGTGQAPYVSAPAAELVELGFVRENRDRSLTYFAPDAEAFLSDAFLDTHCMTLASVRDGLVGLDFEPVRGRRVPDIRGTLWIEAASSTLRRLEFSYVNLPGAREAGGAGGEVVFGRLPNGTWIVREWNIRMPLLSVSPDGSRVSVTGYQVQGGVVWRVVDTRGVTVVEAETGSVQGTVVDSLAVVPLPGARVRVVDGDSAAATGADGSFHFPGLAPGLHILEARHAFLDSLGLGSVRTPVVATAGEVASVGIRIPGAGELLREACGIPQSDRGRAVVFGRVTWQGAAVAGAPVRFRWLGTDRVGFDASTLAAPPVGAEEGPHWRELPEDPPWLGTVLDERGIFMVCGVPERTQIRFEAGSGDGAVGATARVPPDAAAVFVPITLPPSRTP